MTGFRDLAILAALTAGAALREPALVWTGLGVFALTEGYAYARRNTPLRNDVTRPAEVLDPEHRALAASGRMRRSSQGHVTVAE